MAKDTIILSIDTSSLKLSIALLKGRELMGRFSSSRPNSQSSGMLDEIDRLLSRHSCAIDDIGAFSVGLGPGSFTGLRIGITMMRAMALALKKSIVGVPSIDATAAGCAGNHKDICVIIDAKQSKVYARLYRQHKAGYRPASRILLISIDKLIARIRKPTLFTGDGLSTYKEAILKSKIPGLSFAPEEKWYPDAAVIGSLGFDKTLKGEKDNVFTLSPLYIYPKECSIKKRKKP